MTGEPAPHPPRRRAHPLFQRPWGELSWIIWATYLVLPPLETLLITPYERLTDLGYLRFELLCNLTGVVCTGGVMHVLYGAVLPRLPFRPASPPGRVLVHAAVILAGSLLGAELAFPVELLRHGELDPLRYRLQHYRLGILFSTALVGVMVFYDALRARQLRAHEQRAAAEQRARLAQLEALQVRTDPHFLFNVLNAIACLVELEPRKGVEALERLGGLFRRVLDQSMAPTAALRDELAIVGDYLAIEALRHEHLRYAIDADSSTLDAAIPPLLVQPLVENAVKHGAAATVDDVEIRVEARRVGGVLRVEVRDDARPEHPAAPGAGKSLAIIRERLALTHGDAARCQWSSTSPAGSVATLELPLQDSP